MFNNKYYLGGYYKEDSRIHKLNPTTKIISLFILLISIIISRSMHNLILVNLYILTIILYSNIKPTIYLKHLLYFKLPLFLLVLLSLIITKNIITTLYILIQLIDILLIIITLIMTTTPLEINSSLSTILDRKLIHNKKIILNITLLLMSIPIIKETNKEIKISKSIRGVERKDLNIKNKIKFIHNNIEPTIRITKYKMKKISTMMEIKNYSYNQRRTNYKLNKMKIFDKLVLVMDVIIFILVIIY